MQPHCENIYKIARKSAGLTQIQAAEAINVSVRSLADYETGKTIPPDDVVAAMVEVYGAPWLAYQHLKQSTTIGQRFLPDITIMDIARAVLRFKKEVQDLVYIDTDMIDIACDGIIEDSEKERWQKIEKEVDEVISAAFALIFAETSQKEKALVRAS